jgi:flagellar basal-body rod modification protein FlgD
MQSVSSILGPQVGDAQKAKTGLGNDFETFLTLLTTQLQYQDPLEPMDSGEFTSQLVQFTNVEQQIQQNENLENIAVLTAMNGLNASVGFIGKDAIVEQAQATLSGGQAHWIYALEGQSEETTLTIKDELGKTVYEQAGELNVGSHGFIWDGIGNDGTQQADGAYSLTIKTQDGADGSVPVQVFMRAKVTAVDFAGGDSFLDVGGFSVPLGNIVSVREPKVPTV